MSFFSKSIARKFFLYSAVFTLFISAVLFYFKDRLSSEMLIYLFLAYVLIFSLIYFFTVAKPLKVVLFQMQALLTGKPYKRIYTNRLDEIGVLAFFFNQVTKGLGEVSYDLKDRERMLSELNVASQLQRDILPSESPKIDGLKIVAKTKPATELGGDSFNIFTVNDKSYIYIGDVTGHGVSAGLIMTMVNSLVTVFADVYPSIFDIIVHVNRYIKRHVKKAMFMTMVMLCFDHQTKKMTYVGAGHEHILVYRAGSGLCEAILSGGTALGMVPDNSKIVKEKEIILEEGDFIVLYSDGITEARNPAGELYGLERVKKAVVEYAPQYSAAGVNYHIAQDVTSFMGTHVQDDDMTLIVIKRDSTVETPEEVDRSTDWKS